MPHCLHLGLLRPRSVFGGVSVRCTTVLAAGTEEEEEAAVAETAATGKATVLAAVARVEAPAAVVMAVSVLLLLRAGEGAAIESELFEACKPKSEREDSNWRRIAGNTVFG